MPTNWNYLQCSSSASSKSMVRRALLQLGCASGLMLLTVTNCPFHSKLEIEVKMEELEFESNPFLHKIVKWRVRIITPQLTLFASHHFYQTTKLHISIYVKLPAYWFCFPVFLDAYVFLLSSWKFSVMSKLANNILNLNEMGNMKDEPWKHMTT